MKFGQKVHNVQFLKEKPTENDDFKIDFGLSKTQPSKTFEQLSSNQPEGY